MNFLKKLSARKPKSSPSNLISESAAKGAYESKPQIDDAPPAYYSAPITHTDAQNRPPGNTPADSAFDFLGQFDTIFVIDDSGSMAGSSWHETSAALSAIAPICTEHDVNGVDIYFLNARNPNSGDSLGGYAHITTEVAVKEIFSSVQPAGGTPTGTRLNAILKDYVSELGKTMNRQGRGKTVEQKPLNIIVITDGVATDDVESAIVSAAKKLDKIGAEPWQVGIQFFQVGSDAAAADDLRELDDALSAEHGIRDMVDTVPWTANGAMLTAEGIMKVTMGAINRKLDRKAGSHPSLRVR